MEHSTHYDLIAQKFNTLWQFSQEYKDFVIEHIHRTLDLNHNDVLVDLGGGTGTFSQRLSEEAYLKKVYCIEPSKEMCLEASHLKNIHAICADADGFTALNLPYSKMLLKEVIHHIPERPQFWKKVYAQLPIGGRLLIITRPQDVLFPFWDDAKEAFKKNQPPFELLKDELYQSGFNVEIDFDTHTFDFLKESWFTMIRMRFMSDLSHFSNKEIEEGILQIDTLYPNDILQIHDHLIFITATKP